MKRLTGPFLVILFSTVIFACNPTEPERIEGMIRSRDDAGRYLIISVLWGLSISKINLDRRLKYLQYL